MRPEPGFDDGSEGASPVPDDGAMTFTELPAAGAELGPPGPAVGEALTNTSERHTTDSTTIAARQPATTAAGHSAASDQRSPALAVLKAYWASAGSTAWRAPVTA